MHIFSTSAYVLPLPQGHRFPMAKYSRLRERVAAVAGDRLRVPDAATDVELARVHDPAYIAAVAERSMPPRFGGSAFRGRRRWSSARDVPPVRRSAPAARRWPIAAA